MDNNLNTNNKLTGIPYAKWLETSLKELVDIPVKGICINAITETGEAYTNYYNISMMDKLTVAGLIQQDAMIDTLSANGMVECIDEDESETNTED